MNQVSDVFGQVNRTGGKEISGFIPTQHELSQIVKYWFRELPKILVFTNKSVSRTILG